MATSGGGPLVLGIDLGGTKILAGVVGPDNKILGRAKCPTPAQEGGEAILKMMVECVDEALASAGVSRGGRRRGAGSARPARSIPRRASSCSART